MKRKRLTRGKKDKNGATVRTAPAPDHCAVLFEVDKLPVRRLDTPTHPWGFLYFHYFLHCRIIVKTSKIGNNTNGKM
jgi:hypothetical protein